MNQKKVIILTHPLENNYGGLLQAYALQAILLKMGFDVVTDRYGSIIYNPANRWYIKPIRKLYYRLRGYRYISDKDKLYISQNTRKFVDSKIRYVDFYKGQVNPISEEVSKYDIFVVGSDQIWREGYCNVDSFFLPFVPNEKIKIAYAASFGTDNINDWTEDNVIKRRNYLSSFNGVSVREESGVNICKTKLGHKAIHVLDPSLLLNSDDYEQIIKDADYSVGNGEFIFSYILDKSESKRSLIIDVANHLNMKVLEGMPQELLTRDTKDINRCVYDSVPNWLFKISRSNFVITDSFHGVAFSVIFNKQFCVIANEKRGQSRIESLLRLFHLEDRLIKSIEDFYHCVQNPIVFEKVNITKKEWQDKSISFLKTYLYD